MQETEFISADTAKAFLKERVLSSIITYASTNTAADSRIISDAL